MLPVKYRIKKEFLPLVLKKNKVFSSPHFNIRVHNRLSSESNFGQDSRIAVIISNKVAPLSVSRHLIKRRLHGILEKIWGEMVKDIDFILQVKENTLDLGASELENELLGLLRAAKALK